MFADRRDAGRRLAERLAAHASDKPVVLGMPRGGVPVAAEIAERLGAPLDIIVARKIGCPWQPELALGAIAEGGHRVVDDELIAATGVDPAELDEVLRREAAELARRVERYRAGRAPVPLRDRVVIIVDDGIATGCTARAAIAAIRALGPRRLVLAAPVASRSAGRELGSEVDEVVIGSDVPLVFSIGEAYADFRPTTDDEVTDLLDLAAERVASGSAPAARQEEAR
ncbi:MAG TPA: phosphoribosyltransferase family protein [Candidatus Limnocylindrales bacterium]